MFNDEEELIINHCLHIFLLFQFGVDLLRSYSVNQMNRHNCGYFIYVENDYHYCPYCEENLIAEIIENSTFIKDFDNQLPFPYEL